MYHNEYFKIINKIILAHKIKKDIKSANDFIAIGEVEIDNTDNYTYFNLSFKSKYIENEYKNTIKNRFRYDELPSEYIIINEIGIRSREFDNVKYFDSAGDLLFSYSWTE